MQSKRKEIHMLRDRDFVIIFQIHFVVLVKCVLKKKQTTLHFAIGN